LELLDAIPLRDLRIELARNADQLVSCGAREGYALLQVVLETAVAATLPEALVENACESNPHLVHAAAYRALQPVDLVGEQVEDQSGRGFIAPMQRLGSCQRNQRLGASGRRRFLGALLGLRHEATIARNYPAVKVG